MSNLPPRSSTSTGPNSGSSPVAHFGISTFRNSTARLLPFLPAALLAFMAVLAGGAAWRESPSIDEIIHIGAGVSYVQKLDLRLNEEHPPLAKVIAAAPLVLRGARADYSDPSWTISRDFFPAFVGELVFGELVLNHWNDPTRTVAWMRFPMLLLTLALGWVVYAYARRMGGAWGGLVCLSAYVSMPVFLAFGPRVLTDLAAPEPQERAAVRSEPGGRASVEVHC